MTDPMQLTTQQSHKLLTDHGCYVTDVCDRCGQALGAVRFTRKGENGEWCSRECRGDGERQKIHRGGRPRKYKDDHARKNAHAQQQREFRLRSSVTKTCQQPDVNKGLAGAKWPIWGNDLTGSISACQQGFTKEA
jgi:hypothetical protein